MTSDEFGVDAAKAHFSSGPRRHAQEGARTSCAKEHAAQTTLEHATQKAASQFVALSNKCLTPGCGFTRFELGGKSRSFRTLSLCSRNGRVFFLASNQSAGCPSRRPM